ncbi:hypothetical protein H5410_042769 [Solanum commersonii]|uniref:Uncharacterized protein n=1 Tax=Solanum commersonii TaxID=4109 RepID=A0A9J5XXA3_SOLCO|nr:hypothetical protein H5410_042769 [Solanum commersonii]
MLHPVKFFVSKLVKSVPSDEENTFIIYVLVCLSDDCSWKLKPSVRKKVTDIRLYCSDYYKSDALANTYEISMISMSDKDDWSVSKFVLEEIVLPHRYKRMPGRPRKRRGEVHMKS